MLVTILRENKDLDRRAAELGTVVREIVKRFEAANLCAADAPHCDLTVQELRVVELLSESGGQMMRAVAEFLGVAVNSLTSIADGLERKGILRRVRNDADRRVVHVELTPEGQSVADGVLSVKQRFHREMLAKLTEEEQAILLVLLRKIGGIKDDATNAVATAKSKPASVSTRRLVNSRATPRTDRAHRKVRSGKSS